MNANETPSGQLATSPLTVVVSAWDRNRITPGSDHYLGVTLVNRGDQDAVIQVRLESPSDLLQQWCLQTEQWLALNRGKSGELTFCIRIPGDAVPQWLNYDVVVRPQGTYGDYYIPPTPCRLQILAPETTETTQDPTFAISPLTTPNTPVMVQSGVPVVAELVVENRSERVDRFRLECTGLPEDWAVKVDYPRNYSNLGLIQIEDSLGLNPGDRGTIQVFLQAPPLPLAGNYLPTFRLASENDPDLGLLALMYLRVEPVYSLQSQLQVIQDQVRNDPAQFTVQFANLGNTPRQVNLALKSLAPPEDCLYYLPGETVTLEPQGTAQIPLEAQPQRWWTRPWFGGGKVYGFRLDLTDVDRHPVIPDTHQGYVTWMPRPWWQLLLLALLALGIIGTLAFLIWWNFLRPPTPARVVEFAAEDSRYSEANGDMARVRWQIENPQQIRALRLTGYSPEGELLSGPLTYEFQDGQLPAALQPFCTQQKTLLSCSQIRSDAFQPGKYVFELTLIPRRPRSAPIAAKTSSVEIVAKPLPTVTALVAKSLIYREASPGAPSPAEKAIPVVDRDGIRLDWLVTMPRDLAALHLVGRDKDGKLVGERWYTFSKIGQLPEALQPYCLLEQTLICRSVPTGLATVGEYRFELKAIAAGQPDNAAKPVATEVVKIQPQTPKILSFQINGREAPVKLLIPFQPGQTPPVIEVSWRVQGSSTTQLQLTPAPGNVPLSGKMSLPLSPQSSTTLALTVKLPTGEPLTRSVTLEVYSPVQSGAEQESETPAVPPVAPSPPSGASAAPAPSGPPPLDAPTPAENVPLAPAEQPPQFNRR
ncbi:MAG: hypothetical protein SFW36_07575 [Leptolyngbyaceae cyanobacterium bins.59]|nr:hypothetical protein [Leptolyngbyaceae cyanobacterium bins.59]